MKTHIKTLLATTFTSFVIAGAHAAPITYVDAVEGAAGNTYATGGSLADTSWINPDTGSSNDQDQWKKRGFANNGTIFQARHSLNPDEMPELTTEIAGLDDGIYDVWAFFWDAPNANRWTLSTGLTSGALTTYSFDGPGDTVSPVDTATLSFTNPILKTEGDRILYGVYLGEQVVSGGSTINVFVDNLVGGDSANRTWYDGVGYTAIPEPTSLVAGLIGFGGLCIRRRKA